MTRAAIAIVASLAALAAPDYGLEEGDAAALLHEAVHGAFPDESAGRGAQED